MFNDFEDDVLLEAMLNYEESCTAKKEESCKTKNEDCKSKSEGCKTKTEEVEEILDDEDYDEF